ARQLAQAIHRQSAPVEIWTTTGRDSFAPPQPYYAESDQLLDDIPVRRFTMTLPTNEPYVPLAVARRRLPPAWLAQFPAHELRLLASLVSSDILLAAIAS